MTSVKQVHQEAHRMRIGSQCLTHFQWQSLAHHIYAQVGDLLTLQCGHFATLPVTVQLTKCTVSQSLVGQLEAVSVVNSVDVIIPAKMSSRRFMGNKSHQTSQKSSDYISV